MFQIGDEDRGYQEWISDLMQSPTSGGAKGCCFYLVILPVLVIAGLWGLSLFPPGRYPRIVLLAPGAIVGGIILVIYGYISYWLPGILSVPLSLAIAIMGSMMAYSLFGSIFH